MVSIKVSIKVSINMSPWGKTTPSTEESHILPPIRDTGNSNNTLGGGRSRPPPSALTAEIFSSGGRGLSRYGL